MQNKNGMTGIIISAEMAVSERRAKRPRSLRSLALGFMLLGMCLVISACSTTSEPQFADIEEGAFTPVIEGIEMLRVGDQAPLFEVSDISGNRVKFEEKLGEDVVVLLFWSVYCDPCRESMQAYNELFRKYRTQGLNFLTVNMDGAEMSNAIQAFLRDEDLDLTVLLDELDGDMLRIADPYGVQGTPTIYIIDRDGQIAFGRVGAISFDNLSSLIKRELEKH
jgi:peroxiredoxin